MRLIAFAALLMLGCGRGCGGESPRPLPLAEPSSGGSSGTPAPGNGSPAPPPATPVAAERTLFVGNSFTFVNDLPGTYGALAKTIAGNASGATVDSVAYAGYTLAQHLADAQGTGSNPRLASVLGVKAGSVTWNHVLLQEQSEIPGFATNDPALQSSITAAVGLSALVVARGATPVLFMTWGFPTGDPINPTLFPDYPTMQSHLEEGYRAMAHAIAAAGRPVVIAPAGLAFKAVYDRDVAAGLDPKASGSLFAQLYGPDAKHPAPPGTYVTACVVIGTIYGVDPTTLTDGVAGVDAPTKAVLRGIARDVVATERARGQP